MSLPLDRLQQTLGQSSLSRFLLRFLQTYPDIHLKDLTVDEYDDDRRIVVGGRRVCNFGSDSFLGLDRDERVQRAIADGVRRWGTHNGTSRAFASTATNVEVERRLARWLGTEAVLTFPSVTLTNLGVIPGLVGKKDFIAFDAETHNSVQEGIRLAKAADVCTANFAHDDVRDLERVLTAARPYRHALVAVDGVYSMSGSLPPLREIADAAQRHDGVLYVDDAHGTGVVGPRGRGAAYAALGGFDNTLVVGSLSKAFSCLGGFVGCPASLVDLLKIHSNTYLFGGPIAPAYLDGILAALEIIDSPEYDVLRAQLDANVVRVTEGARGLGLICLGGVTPIVSIFVGDEETTVRAGYRLFELGYYVQSVTFPAVPFRAGVLRIQLNAVHTAAAVNGLLQALAECRDEFRLPTEPAGDGERPRLRVV